MSRPIRNDVIGDSAKSLGSSEAVQKRWRWESTQNFGTDLASVSVFLGAGLFIVWRPPKMSREFPLPVQKTSNVKKILTGMKFDFRQKVGIPSENKTQNKLLKRTAHWSAGGKAPRTAQVTQARGVDPIGTSCPSVTRPLFFDKNARFLPPANRSKAPLGASFCDFGVRFCVLGVR